LTNEARPRPSNAGVFRIGALRIAARFFDRSEATKTFKRGMDAHNNPGFYRQLGKDPDLLLSAENCWRASSVCGCDFE
jgi:hypothetical protein